MAWTKTKTAITAGVVALLLIGPAVTIVELLLPAPNVMKEYIGPDNGKSLASGMKRYVSSDGDFTVDLPGDWRTYPHITKYNEIGKFRTPEDGLKAVFYAPSYNQWLTLEKRRDDQAKVNTRAGYRILGKSETTINGKKTLILDTNKDTTNIRNYFFKEGDYIYSVLFYAFNTEGIPHERIEEYERVMKSINIIKEKPKVAGMEEYAGPDNGKPLASGMKRYISPEDDYTVDVPDDWGPHAEETKFGRAYMFGTPENGITANFYQRVYSPLLTLEQRRDNDARYNSNQGWKILNKSVAVLNGRKVSMYDFTKDATSVRNYFFKEENYIYSVQFYAFNTDSLPPDRVEESERVMKSINILKK